MVGFNFTSILNRFVKLEISKSVNFPQRNLVTP